MKELERQPQQSVYLLRTKFLYFDSYEMKPRSLFLFAPEYLDTVYNDESLAQIHELTENNGQVYAAEDIFADPVLFEDVEIIFSAWGCPQMSSELLVALPRLKALFYASGSVRGLISDAFWARDILLTSAFQVNAIPVAEYACASIVFALKRAWSQNQKLRDGSLSARDSIDLGMYYGSTVGVVSLGAIGQAVCQRLQHFDVDVIAYDPFAVDELFDVLQVERVDSLEALFERGNVVSLHAPSLPQTEGMIRGEHLRRMPKKSTFVNTARGQIVNESEMVEVLCEREDLYAVLDVLVDESAFHASPLARMKNVFLTPHIAGAVGVERARMGAAAVEECRRYLNGKPPICSVTQTSIHNMA